MNRGFTVIELLIALAIISAIAAAMAQVVEPARAAFARVPADLDLQQRGRTAIDAISQALRSSGAHAVVAADPEESGDAFRVITVMVPVVNGAQAVLADPSAAAAPLTLATTPCPNVSDVCGFIPGMTAVVADDSGQYDVFVVASTSPESRGLSADRNLSRSYPIGSPVIEIEQYTFSLARQPDGSFSLIRETAAGAIQPMVDFVTALSFTVTDRRVDVSVTVQAATEALRGAVGARVFRTSIRLRNAS